MPGPPPKPASARARRNKVAGARTLTVAAPRKAPPLPQRPIVVDGPTDWHDQTVEWWIDTWQSPMSPEFDDSDMHALVMLAVLIDDFWWCPSKELAAEIRLQRACFGLTPLDRRRLQWEIDRGDEAGERTSKRRKASGERAAAGRPKAVDPRSILAS